MPLVRILVDAFSLLHEWTELAPGQPRFSRAAREELIHHLRLYHDASGTPLTLVFDGAGPTPNVDPETPSTHQFEIIYSKTGQTADDIIERVAARLVAYGEVLVVTDDSAERETISSAGAASMSCANFVQLVASTLGELEHDLERHNRKEISKFRKRP